MRLILLLTVLLCGCHHKRPEPPEVPEINLCDWGTKVPEPYDQCLQRLNGVI